MTNPKSHDNPLELKFSRSFETSPEFVFKALTQPDLIKQWFGPPGYTCPVIEVDLKVGGNYHIEMKPPQGDIIKLNGVYKAVNPPKVLEYTWQWDEPEAKETLVKVQFNPSSKGTEVTVEQGEFANEESKEGHKQGWYASFGRLKDVVQT